MKTIIASVVSLLLGLGMGWVLFRGETVVQNVETKVVEPSGAPTERVRIIERDAPAPTPPVPSAAVPGAPAQAQAGRERAAEDELTALRARVDELDRQLQSELLLRRATEGAPINAPAGLAPRFRDEKQLVSTFNAAFKEAGFPGQVSSVDCTEHPCIVFGTGFGDRGDMEKLIQSPSMAPYKDDSMSTFGFSRGDEKDPAARFFGVAVMPGGGEPPEELRKRVTFRVRQMAELNNK